MAIGHQQAFFFFTQLSVSDKSQTHCCKHRAHRCVVLALIKHVTFLAVTFYLAEKQSTSETFRIALTI